MEDLVVFLGSGVWAKWPNKMLDNMVITITNINIHTYEYKFDLFLKTNPYNSHLFFFII